MDNHGTDLSIWPTEVNWTRKQADLLVGMTELTPQDASDALSTFKTSSYIMTGAFDGKRSGTVVKWVSQCAAQPPLLAVSIFRGHWVETLIRDSHCFGLCLLDPSDRLTARKFCETGPRDNAKKDFDPFDALPIETIVTGAPLLRRSPVVFDCLVIRHLDMEADHSLYIAQVMGGKVNDPAFRPHHQNGTHA